MSFGIFANTTGSICPTPLLDESLFDTTGGYQAGRYCGLSSFSTGSKEASCCFPCPMQNWVYPPDWQNRLRIPNYLSILSIALCTLLLLSFLILAPTHSHRHYLSVGLLIPVLLVALSFAIPVSTNPQICFDAITPASMHTSMSCAWTGSLITLGGLGCVIWVFIRSLWLFLRIVYDIAPGRKFMLASIAAGTFLPIAFLVAVLTRTGFSYRMGATCLPNHENAITTFWVWLLMFAVLGFGLQMATTGYCVLVYVRTLRTERSRMSWEGYGRRKEHQDDLETWGNLKKLFLLQWRNILVSVFVLAGSLVFFVVFWTQDKKLGKVSNDQANIRPVKTWILCQVLSKGDKKECRKYVKGFTMDEPVVLTALILASLIGIELFILLFRASMLHAWIDLFNRLFHRTAIARPPTPELTSLANPNMYSLTSLKSSKPGCRFVESLEASESSTASTRHTNTSSPSPSTSTQHLAVPSPSLTEYTPPPTTPPPKSAKRPFSKSMDRQYSTLLPPCPTRIPTPPTIQITSPSPRITTTYFSRTPTSRSLPRPPLRLETYLTPRTFEPLRPVPVPPRKRGLRQSVVSWGSEWSGRTERSWRDSTISALERVGFEGDEEEKKGDRDSLVISKPVDGSFRHVDGAFV